MPSKLYIKMYQNSYETSEVDPEDSWSRASTACDNTLVGIYKTPSTIGHYDEEFIPCFEHEVGQTVYLVWAEYSTGDSFGNDSGKVEFIDIFLSEELADACAKSAEGPLGSHYEFQFVRQNGSTIQQYAPWYGYFENLEVVHVDSLTIQKSRL